MRCLAPTVYLREPGYAAETHDPPLQVQNNGDLFLAHAACSCRWQGGPLIAASLAWTQADRMMQASMLEEKEMSGGPSLESKKMLRRTVTHHLHSQLISQKRSLGFS